MSNAALFHKELEVNQQLLFYSRFCLRFANSFTRKPPDEAHLITVILYKISSRFLFL